MLVNALRDSRLEILPCEGTYFLLVDYSAVSTLNDVEFCQWLTKEVGVAAIRCRFSAPILSRIS